MINFKRSLASAAKSCLDFLYRNFWAVCFYDLFLGFAGYFWVSPNGSVDFFFNLVPHSIIGAFMVASVLMIVRGLLLIGNHKWGRLLAGGITTLAVIIATAEIWVLFMFRCRLTDRILRLILDTDMREANGFLSEYFFNFRSLGIIAGFLLLILAAYLIFKFGWRKATAFIDSRSHYLSGLIGIIILIICILGNYASYKLDALSINSDDSVSRLIRVWNVQMKAKERIKSLESAISLSDGHLPSGHTPPARIIWIIGESDNRYHSQLYGYRLPTTPNLRKEFDDGNLIYFSDAIAYYPWTIYMMELLFSPAGISDSQSNDPASPLVPMLFRKAGYQVRMFDNQSTLVRGIFGADLGGDTFMNSQKLSNANFDYRNEDMEFFDADFLRKEWQIITHPSCPSLDIIHLQGMHVPFSSRYPQEFSIFSPEDYPHRTDLSSSEKQIIADYDNTVRYLDSELKSIFDLVRNEDAIVIYIPDHGELVCDVDGRSGRQYAMDPHPDPKISAFYVEIPMYVFTTPVFRTLHPGLYSRLEAAKDEKFSTAWFSHFLLDIAGIESRYRRPDLSPLSDQWASPVRPIWCAGDYEVWKLSPQD